MFHFIYETQFKNSTDTGPVRNAVIISASQKSKHYEIAFFGTLADFAKTLGETKVAKLLVETLNEEKEADETLSKSAYNNINFKASKED